ncbi:MAG: TRAP transporter substrate-binding protein [Burkholderiaceae bacterium]
MRSTLRKTALALALMTAAGGASAQNKVVLTASSWVPPQHLLTLAQSAWCDDVAAATGQRVSCKLLPKPAAPPPKTFDAVRDGLADLSFSAHGYTPGRYLLTKMAELPRLGDSAIPTSVAYQRIHEKYLAALDEHRGLKVLTVFTHGPGHMFNNKRPIHSVAEIAGIKFRTGGGMASDIGQAIDANLTLKPAPQSYELLSSGVVDGVWFPHEAIVGFKLEKLVKYRTSIPGGFYTASFAFVMNPDTWNRIGKQDQAAIEKLSGGHAARHFGNWWDKYDVKSKAVQQTLGIEAWSADEKFVADFKVRTAGVEAQWVKEAEQRGLKDAAKVLAEFRAEIAKLQ